MSIVPSLYDLERPLHLVGRNFFPEEILGFSPLRQLATRDLFSPEHILTPWSNAFRSWESMMKPIEQLSAAMNHMGLHDMGSNITTDDEKFQENIDVQHFKPEEVNVKVVDGYVIVHGKHEEKRDEHGYVSREFIRRYALPPGCLPDTVQSKLSSDGVLTITAPKVLAMPSTGERIVPITKTGPVQKRFESKDFVPCVEQSK